jgi:hypothetical protein
MNLKTGQGLDAVVEFVLRAGMLQPHPQTHPHLQAAGHIEA